jgi:DNA-binding response OmpR family regulator
MTYEIAIADDDETIREVVEFNLTKEGWDVVVFEDGDDCWEYLESQANEPPSLVVLDVMMPELDGISVLERVRNHESLSDLPVLMLTSRNREEDIVQTLEAGANDFVAKPFSEDELVGKVKGILNES